MGNETSTSKKDVVISRSEYGQTVKYCNDLEYTVMTQKSKISDLENKLKQLQLDNTKNNQEKLQLKNELQKYESSPITKLILKLNDQINELDDKIVKLSNTKRVDKNEIIREEINELSKSIINGTRNLPNNVVNSLSDMKMEEISELKETIRKEESSGETKPSFYDLLQKPREKLEKIRENFMLAIAKDAAKVDKDLSTIEKDVSAIQVSEVNPNYEKLKAILIEQENKILRLQLGMPKPQPKRLEKSDNSLLFCNIPEESTDFRSDYEKIREILNVFPCVSDTNIHVTRVGKRTPRSIRVEFPNIDVVEKILKYRYKLKGSSFSNVRIYGNKNENQN